MEKLICDQCGKIIEGYTLNHVTHLMQQHTSKHDREVEKSETKLTHLEKKKVSPQKGINNLYKEGVFH